MSERFEVIELDNSIEPQDINYCPNLVICECNLICSCPTDGFCGDVECSPNYGACGTRSIYR
ncbi:hypothetical protein [Anaeropeptidivorans aminofermentans]|jgi:hypothetical protein|uniref:hypothetical protein n=1 Tax=Anaeropeptidivorans aminofermentans TaxID=2934315 RepID=UPI002024B6D3|nr:hypothetical protein [Anaeropeptidivorans aminofermentans]